jgi:hypothetical protein
MTASIARRAPEHLINIKLRGLPSPAIKAR